MTPWRFLAMSDLHLGGYADGLWNNRILCNMMPEVMRCLRRDLPKLNSEFILATGDISTRLSRDAMFAARDLMDSLGMPYYPMGGNRDFAGPDSRTWFLEAFEARLPVQETYYSFTYRNLHFCVLDPWCLWEDGTVSPYAEDRGDKAWAIPPHQVKWLEADLRAHAGIPTVVALHYPLVPIPERLHRPDLRDAGHLSNGDLLLALLKEHPQVRAIFSGHLHLHFIEDLGGITQVVTGALPEYPTEFREVTVTDSALEVRTLGLSDRGFAGRSLVAGHEFTAGMECDRVATIPLHEASE